MSSVTSTAGPPATLRWAVALLVVEAVTVALLAVFLVYQGIADEAASLGTALSVAGFTLVVAAVLAGLAFALWHRKPRARAPAIVLQLLAVMYALTTLTGGAVWPGLPAGVIGIVVATLLLTPATTGALTGGR